MCKMASSTCVPEELRHNLRGSNKYSSLDMIHSLQQFELKDEAKKLLPSTRWPLQVQEALYG